MEVLGSVGLLPAGLLLCLTRAGHCALLLMLPLPASHHGHVDFQATLVLTLLQMQLMMLSVVRWSLACVIANESVLMGISSPPSWDLLGVFS